MIGVRNKHLNYFFDHQTNFKLIVHDFRIHIKWIENVFVFTFNCYFDQTIFSLWARDKIKILKIALCILMFSYIYTRRRRSTFRRLHEAAKNASFNIRPPLTRAKSPSETDWFWGEEGGNGLY